MNSLLDLDDIQGNVVRGYARFGFPKARYAFLHVANAAAGRAFLGQLLPMVTSSAYRATHGQSKAKVHRPIATTDIALTFKGLCALEVSGASLRTFPEDFAMGMKARRSILGDDGPSAPENWDPIWVSGPDVHMMIAINAPTPANIEARWNEIRTLIEATQGAVELLKGHRGEHDEVGLEYQEASALYENGEPTAKEHFGYVDGIGSPFFKGCDAHPSNVVGGGKLVRNLVTQQVSWAPLETGEFLLGHRDEAHELPVAPKPAILAKNGTFMVYRKLHQNVEAFEAYMEEEGARFPGGKEALAAKFAGRWRNGAPISKCPNESSADALAEQWTQAKRDIEKSSTPEARKAAGERFSALNERMVDFDYGDDIEGGRCPVGAHIRRTNPRVALEFGQKLAFETPSALADRRRILRRGLPYGARGAKNRGVIFMAMNASISRQFEFVQQQWLNYGNDFRVANEKDPLLGNHGVDSAGGPDGTYVVQSGRGRTDAPYFCSRIPRFVETRGGEYFFIPSLTALRMISQGTVDPT